MNHLSEKRKSMFIKPINSPSVTPRDGPADNQRRLSAASAPKSASAGNMDQHASVIVTASGINTTVQLGPRMSDLAPPIVTKRAEHMPKKVESVSKKVESVPKIDGSKSKIDVPRTKKAGQETEKTQVSSDNTTAPQDNSEQSVAPSKAVGHEYTNEEISGLLSEGYIVVHPALWEYIPVGSHIRYVRRDDGRGLSRGKRFKPGGFVKCHSVNDNNKKLITLESRLNTESKAGPGYFKYSILHDSIEELWKKYDRMAFIEIHLIYNSLAQKKRQIEDLTTRVARLEDTVKRLSGTSRK